jgi:predicted small lipoprotein YifL
MKNIEIKKIGRMTISALFIFALLTTPIVLGCGKKGPPKPPGVSPVQQSSDKG